MDKSLTPNVPFLFEFGLILVSIPPFRQTKPLVVRKTLNSEHVPLSQVTG
jgi:hypothetical protein